MLLILVLPEDIASSPALTCRKVFIVDNSTLARAFLSHIIPLPQTNLYWIVFCPIQFHSLSSISYIQETSIIMNKIYPFNQVTNSWASTIYSLTSILDFANFSLHNFLDFFYFRWKGVTEILKSWNSTIYSLTTKSCSSKNLTPSYSVKFLIKVLRTQSVNLSFLLLF